MQTTSALWKALLAGGNAWCEYRAIIAGTVYTEITAPAINRALTQNGLTIGSAISATCSFAVRKDNAIQRSAQTVIQVRLTDGTQTSEWLAQGTYYIARRTRDPITGVLTLECYDALLKANADAVFYDVADWVTGAGDVIVTAAGDAIEFAGVTFPMTMLAMAQNIAEAIGVEMDARTQIATGTSYMIDQPEDGTTLRDLLCEIAAANGGNWIITPQNKLRLVKVISAAGAAAATENVIDVAGVVGGIQVGQTGTITGLRCTVDGETTVTGNESGIVVDVPTTVPVMLDLADWMIGCTYQSFDLQGAVYDPAAELGDYIRGGAGGEVSAVLYAEGATVGAAYRGALSAPDAEELSDEYPYIGGSKKALQVAKAYARTLTENLDESLDQEGIFNRLTNNGTAQGIYIIDGQVYVNMTYARSGTLVLGGLNNQNGLFQVLDSSGNVIGTWNNAGITLTKGSIKIPLPSGGDDSISINYGDKAFSVIKNGLETDINQYGVVVNPGGYNHTSRNRISSSLISVESFDESINPEVFCRTISGSRNASSKLSDTELEFTSGYVKSTTITASLIETHGDLSVRGTKSRRVKTEQYSDRLLYCYETPSPLFGDVGEGVIGEDGLCYISIDPIFAQTITTSQYQVFLQKYGDGDAWVKERNGAYFVVQGTPGMAFGWEIKAKQSDFDQRRLDKADQSFAPPQQTYGADAAQYIENLMKGRISA